MNTYIEKMKKKTPTKKKRSPHCKFCGKELEGSRRQTCNDACRKGYSRAHQRKTYVIEADLVEFATPEQRAEREIREQVDNIIGHKLSFGIEASVTYKGMEYAGLLYPKSKKKGG